MKKFINRILVITTIYILTCLSYSIALGSVLWPITNSSVDRDTVTSPYGIRYHNGGYDYHGGLDIRARTPIPVYAVETGYVSAAGYLGVRGNYIILEHSDNIGNEYQTHYYHLSEIYVTQGISVIAGTQLATSGASGGNYAPHLHFGYYVRKEGDLLRKNPMRILSYSDTTAPSLFFQSVQVDTTMWGTIDSITILTAVNRLELDFSYLEVHLLTDNDRTVFHFTTEDPRPFESNSAVYADTNDDTDGQLIFAPEDLNFEVKISANPWSFNTDSDVYHIIEWVIDPWNSTNFKNESYIGISGYDININCSDYPNNSNNNDKGIQSELVLDEIDCSNTFWGNTTGDSPRIIVDNFGVVLNDNSEIEISWLGSDYDDIEGINLYRSYDSLNDYSKINNSVLLINTNETKFIDDTFEFVKSCFYKYEIVYTDGQSRMSRSYYKVSNLLPEKFSLKQNYPNPFNNGTRINFSLSENESGLIDLSIYNLLGQKVKTIASGNYKSGNYNISWDGTNSNGHSVSSGIYHYRLRTIKGSLTEKMILLK